MDGAQWHLLKHTLTKNSSNPIGSSLQTELTRQLILDKDRKHRTFSWKLLRIVKSVFHATKYQGDTARTLPPFFQNAGRGTERIWAEVHSSPQPTVINWPGLNDKEKTELIPTLSSTDNWILLTYPLGAKNKSQPPLAESQRIARADGKCSRHKGWWRVCCRMLQSIAASCSKLQCVAVCCSALQCIIMCCSVLQCVAGCCSILRCVAMCCCKQGPHFTRALLPIIYV